jgi:iron complex transport system substrate-binding protein
VLRAMRFRNRVAGPVLAIVVAVLASACAGSTTDQHMESVSDVGTVAAFPVTLTGANGSITISQRPTRIVSLSPTATEMLFAIGAGEQVVAVDDQSNYPPSAPMTQLSGFQPNIEAIAGYSPDLVIAANDVGGLVHGLRALHIPILIEAAASDLDQTYAQIDDLGKATGLPGEAAALADSMKKQIASIVGGVPKPDPPLSVYHELDNTYYSVTSATFIGQVYALLGLHDIADGASSKVADYPQLSAEYVIKSDPDLIVLADTKCCKQSEQTVAARPGWSNIAAVRDGQIIPMDDDIASRWGPRIVDFIRVIADHVREAEAVATP